MDIAAPDCADYQDNIKTGKACYVVFGQRRQKNRKNSENTERQSENRTEKDWLYYAKKMRII